MWGDILFPVLVLPGAIDRIDRQVFRTDRAAVEALYRSYGVHGATIPRQSGARSLATSVTESVKSGLPTSDLRRLSNKDGGGR